MRSSVPLGRIVTARGMAGWRHAFGDIDPTTIFTLDTSDPFQILGAPIAEDAFITEAGLDFAISNAVTAGLSYRGQMGDGTSAHGAVGHLTVQF